MKKMFFLLALLSAYTVTSQTFDENFVSGKWKVKKIKALKDADKPETQELVSGFQKATYIFNADHTFVFDTKSQSKMMLQLEKLFNGKNWIIDAKKKRIKVGLKKEGYSTLLFNVSFEKEKVIFTIEDTAIEMVMKKSN
ncbi:MULTISPECIES: DUF5004 domain-containing protein [Flavobacterium]|uniref:DUF5004 domain-containing protein n=1 Tax=Flavobacterium sedimenticola TaxID=3043286 RepID=A0ABT6XP77_9FLAO|nr:DUF5004 domain-containing protein [Flavobacterium sedimenticola]MDI9256899.1 DUF5004 domain-containing protein [Flavobacterium sedimenticola]